MKLRFCSITFTVMVGSLVLAASANAEIVYLSSSRTISVKGHRVEGDSIILKLRNGGEVTCDKSLIEKIVSDEVPYPEPAGPEAVSQPPAVRRRPPSRKLPTTKSSPPCRRPTGSTPFWSGR